MGGGPGIRLVRQAGRAARDLDFHALLYASATGGYAGEDPDRPGADMQPLFEAIIRRIPAPSGDPRGPLQMQVSTIDHSPFLGRLGIGKITSGGMQVGLTAAVAGSAGQLRPTRITKIYRFDCTRKVETERAGLGDIVAVAGQEDLSVGDTFTDPDQPRPLPVLPIDPPTVSMLFLPNNSPFAGKEGEFITSTHLAERLRREALVDVALAVEELPGSPGFKVSGRGELHLSILIKENAPEGCSISCRQMIFKEAKYRLEALEELLVEMAENIPDTVSENWACARDSCAGDAPRKRIDAAEIKIPRARTPGVQVQIRIRRQRHGHADLHFLEYDAFAGGWLGLNSVLVSWKPA